MRFGEGEGEGEGGTHIDGETEFDTAPVEFMTHTLTSKSHNYMNNIY